MKEEHIVPLIFAISIIFVISVLYYYADENRTGYDLVTNRCKDTTLKDYFYKCGDTRYINLSSGERIYHVSCNYGSYVKFNETIGNRSDVISCGIGWLPNTSYLSPKYCTGKNYSDAFNSCIKYIPTNMQGIDIIKPIEVSP